MKFQKILLNTCFLVGIGISTAYPQSNTVSSGGVASGTGGATSYTIGQIFYQTFSSETGNVFQGVQQAYEVRTLSNEDVTDILLNVNFFPNPTKSNVVLKISNIPLDGVNYQLYDLLGRQIVTQKVKNEESIIQMDELPTAVYVLKIIKNNSVLKSFKIIKNQ
ncbi:MAG: T9SS type A sorting domain-containing protein [Flavobacteriaceae bacterium]|nr:T9SS type A sorting domain-containing protein [Flavobacteriaceae bacterium]